jgi:hypothetical protein
MEEEEQFDGTGTGLFGRSGINFSLANFRLFD